jgi:hypothetical protein
MEEAGLTPNVVTWTTLIDACVKFAARAKRRARKEEVAAVEAALVGQQQELKDRLLSKRQSVMAKQQQQQEEEEEEEALVATDAKQDAKWIEKWDAEANCPFWTNSVSGEIEWKDPSLKKQPRSIPIGDYNQNVSETQEKSAEDISATDELADDILETNDDIRKLVAGILSCFTKAHPSTSAVETQKVKRASSPYSNNRNRDRNLAEKTAAGNKIAKANKQVSELSKEGCQDFDGKRKLLSGFIPSDAPQLQQEVDSCIGGFELSAKENSEGNRRQPSGGLLLRVSAHSLTGDDALRLGLYLFQSMLQRGIRPNRVTCTALMDGLLKVCCSLLTIAKKDMLF